MKTILVATALLTTAIISMPGGSLIHAAPPEGTELVKITKKRIPMDKRLLTLCVGPQAVVGPHAAAEVDIYVNDIVLKYRKENPEAYDYPIGSVFVKNKYPSLGAEDPDLRTIMVKSKNEGAVTDWEFSMESLPDHKPIRPTARVSCAKCHDRYEARGYISIESETALRDHLRSETDAGRDGTGESSTAEEPKPE